MAIKIYLSTLWIGVLALTYFLVSFIFLPYIKNSADLLFSMYFSFPFIIILFLAIFIEFLYFYGIKRLFIVLLIYLIFKDFNNGLFLISIAFVASFITAKITWIFWQNPQDFQSFFFRKKSEKNSSELIKNNFLIKNKFEILSNLFKFNKSNNFLDKNKTFLKTSLQELIFLWCGFLLGLGIYLLFMPNFDFFSTYKNLFGTQAKEFFYFLDLLSLIAFVYSILAFFGIFSSIARIFTYIPIILLLIIALINPNLAKILAFISAFLQLLKLVFIELNNLKLRNNKSKKE